MTILQTEAETTAFTTNFSVVPIELSRRKTPQFGGANRRWVTAGLYREFSVSGKSLDR
jgi:hypothetical protein